MKQWLRRLRLDVIWLGVMTGILLANLFMERASPWLFGVLVMMLPSISLLAWSAGRRQMAERTHEIMREHAALCREHEQLAESYKRLVSSEFVFEIWLSDVRVGRGTGEPPRLRVGGRVWLN